MKPTLLNVLFRYCINVINNNNNNNNAYRRIRITIEQFYITLAFVIIIDSVRANILPVASTANLEHKSRCQPFETDLCNIDSYSTLRPFRNTLGHTNIETAIAELHKYYFLFNSERCKANIQLFLCSLYAPVCLEDRDKKVPQDLLQNLLLPCRDICEEARNVCWPNFKLANLSWPEDWRCEKFNYTNVDPLCVINNNRTKSSETIVNPTPPVAPNVDIISQPTGELGKQIIETYCDKDLFDCRLLDPTRNMRALCIEPEWVCDGKKDCVINGTSAHMTDGLDELHCDKKCDEGIYCEGRCVTQTEICDGKLACGSGTDELDCASTRAGSNISLLQFALIIAIGFLMVCLILKMKRVKKEKATSEPPREEQFEQPHYMSSEEDLEVKPQHTPTPPVVVDQIVRPLDFGISRQFEHESSIRSHIYNELAYSTSMRGDYERLNDGDSAASSVYAYAFYHHPHHHSLGTSKGGYLKEPPAAPPPTPAPQHIYPSGSLTQDNPYLNIN